MSETAPNVTELVNEPVAAPAPVAEPPRKKRVVIALPGREYSQNFLLSFVRTFYALWESNKYEIVISPGYSSFVTFARMKTMGLDVLRGADQKPFNGLDYDVWVTIDSDMVWNPEQFVALLDSTDVHPVVSGLYRMADLEHFACVKTWDTEYFKKHGTFQFMRIEDLKTWKEETQMKFMEVSYNGMGFFAARKEVLDKLSYPFYDAPVQEIVGEDGKLLRDMCSEDVAFCKNIQKAGYSVYVNTDIIVGHEKMLII